MSEMLRRYEKRTANVGMLMEMKVMASEQIFFLQF